MKTSEILELILSNLNIQYNRYGARMCCCFYICLKVKEYYYNHFIDKSTMTEIIAKIKTVLDAIQIYKHNGNLSGYSESTTMFGALQEAFDSKHHSFMEEFTYVSRVKLLEMLIAEYQSKGD